jgi:hypothetical protein
MIANILTSKTTMTKNRSKNRHPNDKNAQLFLGNTYSLAPALILKKLIFGNSNTQIYA